VSAVNTKWILAGVAAAIAAAIAFATRKASAIPMPACNDTISAVHHGGTRSLSNLRLIVLHSTEGRTARGAAGWFANPDSAGSAHVVVDDQECYRTLPDSLIPWGAKGGDANENGLHIEIAGFAADNPTTGDKAFTRDEWLSHMARLRKAASVVWAWGKMYGIPMRFVDAAGLLRGESGVTSHYEITKAYHAGDHIDPGKAFPYDVMMNLLGSNAYGYVA